MTKEEIAELDAIVSPLIQKGQPVAHIMRNHSDEILISERSLYNYIGNGYLSVKRLDLRRAVRYKPRKQQQKKVKVFPKKKLGRHYRDFLKLLELNPAQRVVEMDTVEGIKGGKVVQTLYWRENGFMIGFLQDTKEMEGMVNSFNHLENLLGLEQFREMIPLVLTDNGSEFADPETFESSLKEEELRTSIYYCEPRQSQQKGSLEKNHEYIRYVVPKGSSFDSCNQETINLIFSHINSTVRPRFEKTPYEMVAEEFGEETLKKLGLEKSLPDDVDLTPNLIS